MEKIRIYFLILTLLTVTTVQILGDLQCYVCSNCDEIDDSKLKTCGKEHQEPTTTQNPTVTTASTPSASSTASTTPGSNSNTTTASPPTSNNSTTESSSNTTPASSSSTNSSITESGSNTTPASSSSTNSSITESSSSTISASPSSNFNEESNYNSDQQNENEDYDSQTKSFLLRQHLPDEVFEDKIPVLRSKRLRRQANITPKYFCFVVKSANGTKNRGCIKGNDKNDACEQLNGSGIGKCENKDKNICDYDKCNSANGIRNNLIMTILFVFCYYYLFK